MSHHEPDLEHLFLSLKHTEYSGVITPARCRKCGFEFAKDKTAQAVQMPGVSQHLAHRAAREH